MADKPFLVGTGTDNNLSVSHRAIAKHQGGEFSCRDEYHQFKRNATKTNLGTLNCSWAFIRSSVPKTMALPSTGFLLFGGGAAVTEVDGSEGEGGGQILRTTLSLSQILSKPVGSLQ
jgi:hypothetical protein